MIVERTLYGYWRSTATYRVRIALALKGLDYRHQPVNLLENEQGSDDFTRLNVQGLVPLYQEKSTDDRVFHLPQSLAIIDYLEARYPLPSLLPKDAEKCAQVKALAQTVACDIHPLNNLRVLKYLQNHLAVSENAKTAWYQHWIATGFAALEKGVKTLLAGDNFSLEEHPGYLEAIIIPQIFNAHRWCFSMQPYPRLQALATACQAFDAFTQAHPNQQPDAVTS